MNDKNYVYIGSDEFDNLEEWGYTGNRVSKDGSFALCGKGCPELETRCNQSLARPTVFPDTFTVKREEIQDVLVDGFDEGDNSVQVTAKKTVMVDEVISFAPNWPSPNLNQEEAKHLLTLTEVF